MKNVFKRFKYAIEILILNNTFPKPLVFQIFMLKVNVLRLRNASTPMWSASSLWINRRSQIGIDLFRTQQGNINEFDRRFSDPIDRSCLSLISPPRIDDDDVNERPFCRPKDDEGDARLLRRWRRPPRIDIESRTRNCRLAYPRRTNTLARIPVLLRGSTLRRTRNYPPAEGECRRCLWESETLRNRHYSCSVSFSLFVPISFFFSKRDVTSSFLFIKSSEVSPQLRRVHFLN